jgi:hypothetical protein
MVKVLNHGMHKKEDTDENPKYTIKFYFSEIL